MISLATLRSFPTALDWVDLLGIEFAPAARAIIAALTMRPGYVPSPDVLAGWKLVTRERFPASPPSQVIEQIGRGGLKTTLATIAEVDRLLRYANEERVGPGGEIVALHCAPTQRQASDAIRAALPYAQGLGRMVGAEMSEHALRDGAELRIRLPGIDATFVLRAAAADEASLRGRAFCSVVWTEAGWFPSGPKSIGSLADLRAAVIPRSIGQFPWALEIVESTNGPPAGYFYDICQKTPKGTLRIGPLPPNVTNPTISLARLEAELSPEIYSQEVLCRSWGAKSAAWFPAGPSMAIVDEDGKWTDGTVGKCLGARVAFDHGGRDEIATLRGRAVEVEVGRDHWVRHLVIDAADRWLPGRAPPTSAQVRTAISLSDKSGGIPILCDGRAIADVGEVAVRHRFRVPEDCKDDDARRRHLLSGGRKVIEMPMGPRHQTERFSRLRELVVAGRVHVVDSDAGRELARQLVSLRATQLASKFLRIEAESGAEDGLADCASYLAEAFDAMPATRAGGDVDEIQCDRVHWDGRHLHVSSRWVVRDSKGRTRPGEPPIDDPLFAKHYVDNLDRGLVTPRMIAFAAARLGVENPTHEQMVALATQMVESDEAYLG